MNSNKIVQLLNPTSNQDAATKSYVDTKFTTVPTPTNTNDAANKGYVDTATTNMATTSSVSTAISTALGANGTQENRPTVQRGDTTNETHYLTYINGSDIPGDGSSKRALMRCDGGLTYNPNTNTLTAGTFSGSLSGNATSANTAGYLDRGTSATGFYYNGSWTMYADPNTRRVGINTETPVAALHVVPVTPVASISSGGHYLVHSGVFPAETTTRPTVCYFGGGWVVSDTGYITNSDYRIKTDISCLNKINNLQIFRKLIPVTHSYIDKLSFGNVTKYGFIAQEVQKILPDAVVKDDKQVVPSIYKTSTIVNHQTLHFDNPIQDIQQFNIGTKLKCYDDKNKIVWVTIKEIIDSQNIEIEETITNDKLFIYGHSVDDFLHLDKDAIYTVATAALQEVDRQQQADKARIAELEATVSAQQSLINDILERLKALEKA